MIFCNNCFKDKELARIILSVSKNKGYHCPVCGNANAAIYNTDTQSDLTPIFEDLLNIYSPASSLPDGYNGPMGDLFDELNNRWGIFEDISQKSQRDIIVSICSNSLSDYSELYDCDVGIPLLSDPLYLMDHSLLKNNNWSEFVKAIKTKNRFHSNLIRFDILEEYCSYIRKTYKAGAFFYRARISEQSGFSRDEMSAPPAGKSSEGRANARGITCLYIANDIDTTLHEVRAGVFDYVCVGTFCLKRDITVVDLKAIAEISPFIGGLNYVDYAINKEYLEQLDYEMSKPLRRSDSTLDYVPTQYIVDYIKSILNNDGNPEYDGIEYKSSTNPGGYNLAIFDPDLFECTSVDIFDIKELNYTKEMITNTCTH